MTALQALQPLGDRTRRGQIVAAIRKLIVTGQVTPGERLTETDLADQLGVSRAPLREAIRELVENGLLVAEPYKGLFVRSFTRKDLEELYSLRTALEQFAFREAWPKRTEARKTDLRDRDRKLDAAIAIGDDPALAIEAELFLHSWCYEVSGHSLLQQAWTRIRPNLQFYFTLHQRAHNRPHPLREAHDLYVSLACGDDLDAMLSHLEDHMRQGLAKVMQFIGEDG